MSKRFYCTVEHPGVIYTTCQPEECRRVGATKENCEFWKELELVDNFEMEPVEDDFCYHCKHADDNDRCLLCKHQYIEEGN